MSQLISNVIGGLYQPFAFETISVSTSVKTLSSSVYNPTTVAQNPLYQATYAIITCETATLRYRFDGGVPVAGTTGHQLTAGSSVVLSGWAAIINFQIVSDAGSTGTIQVTYER